MTLNQAVDYINKVERPKLVDTLMYPPEKEVKIPTLKEAFYGYREEKKNAGNLRPQTALNYEKYCDKHLKLLHNKDVDKITQSDLVKVKNKLQKNGLSSKTVKTLKECLSPMFNYDIEDQSSSVTYNPTARPVFKNKVLTVMISVAIALMGATITASAQMKDVAKSQQLPTENQMIVAYYGRPGVSSMGVIGKYSLEAIIPIIKAKANEYKKASGNQNIVPGFDIVYDMATILPGRNKNYINTLPRQKLMPYIHAANEHDFALFLDLQLGKKTPVQSIKSVLKYLKYKNVHIAIDPEFNVHGAGIRPGKIIGHITGNQVNQIQAEMSTYMKKHGITEKKILIVHMFRHSMLTNKKVIKTYDNISLVFNLDGFGSANLKVSIYNSIYTKRISKKVASGFKLFFNQDKPYLMTPKQVLGIDLVNDARIKEAPKYINYQ